MFLNVCSPSGTLIGDYTFFPDPCSRDPITDASDVWKGWSMKLEPGTPVFTESIPKWQWNSDTANYYGIENTVCNKDPASCTKSYCPDCGTIKDDPIKKYNK